MGAGAVWSRRTMRRLPTAIRLLLAAFALVAVACSPAGVPSPSEASASIWGLDRPPGDRILQVAVEGGSSERTDLLTRLPVFVIYADGSLLAPGRLEGVNPMIRPLMRLRVPPTHRERVDELVAEMGLREVDRIIDEPLPGTLVDGSTMVATYFDEDGRARAYGAYGLSPQTAVPLPPEIGFLPGTNTLAELASMFSQAGADAAAVPYEPERIQLFLTRPTSADEASPWPLDILPSAFVSSPDDGVQCLVVTGPPARDAAAALAATGRNVIFEHEEEQIWLLARVLVPGEPGCGPEVRQ